MIKLTTVNIVWQPGKGETLGHRIYKQESCYVNPNQICFLQKIEVRVGERIIRGTNYSTTEYNTLIGTSITTPGGMNEEMCGICVLESIEQVMNLIEKDRR